MKIDTFKLERYFAEFEFSAKFLLSSSDCEPLGLNELLEMADDESHKQWINLKFAYTESQGLPVLREQIASMYEGIHPDQVIILGPQEGIFLTMNTLLESGDEVGSTFPGYQSLYEVAKSKGCKVSYWKPDQNHEFSIQDLELLVGSDTRMLVMNFPHNPTGAILTRIQFDQVVELCRKHDIILFSDEMYRYLEYDTEDRLPSAAEVNENSVTLCGMSKSFALPGLRLGWLIIHQPDWLQSVQNFKDYTTICPPAPSEILALIGIKNKDQIITRNLEIIRRNILLMEEFEVSHPDFIRWIPPKAGSIAFPELLLSKDIEHFCRCLIKKTGVMLLPSTVYDYPGSYFRLGLGRTGFSDGLAALDNFLK
ncbi:MAG: aminotransferase class I/II-fold pyridoxal phosphate-dependent enzyme [Bacteroidota bacterium]|nr:aminotransferase class I/II-fold pyridoxal phosphate-dependent enzyme [Bacteroidota bacterium]